MAEGGSRRGESDWNSDYRGDVKVVHSGDLGGVDVKVVDSADNTTWTADSAVDAPGSSDDWTANEYDSSEDESFGLDTKRTVRRNKRSPVQELDKQKCDIEAAMRAIKIKKAQMERALDIEVVKRMEALRMETDQDVSTDRSRGSRTETSKSLSAVKRKKNLERDQVNWRP